MGMDEIRQSFPGWVLWRSDGGRWWATWPTPMTHDQIRHGCARTIDADSAENLAARLTIEEQLKLAASQ